MVVLAKNYAKEHNWSVIPQELETQIFGGVVTFELEETGIIEGVEISARIDDMVVTDDESNMNLFLWSMCSYCFELAILYGFLFQNILLNINL